MSGAMSASALIATGSFFETDEPAVFDPPDLLCDIVEFIRMTDDQECFLIFLCIDIMNEIFYCLLIEIHDQIVSSKSKDFRNNFLNKKKNGTFVPLLFQMVRPMRLERTRPKSLPPQSSVSADSTTASCDYS